jgi:hypothetical protein
MEFGGRFVMKTAISESSHLSHMALEPGRVPSDEDRCERGKVPRWSPEHMTFRDQGCKGTHKRA